MANVGNFVQGQTEIGVHQMTGASLGEEKEEEDKEEKEEEKEEKEEEEKEEEKEE